MEELLRLISLGKACETAFQIRLHTPKVDADFFDWLITPFDGLMKILHEEFSGHLNPRDLYLQDDRNFINNAITGVQYGHVFLRDAITHLHPDNFLDDLERVQSIFDYLAEKFIRNASAGLPLGFVRREIIPSQALELESFFRARFPELQFNIIAVNGTYQGVGDLDPARFSELTVPASGPDGLGLADEWATALVGAGLTDRPFQKTKDDVFNRLMVHMAGDVRTLAAEDEQ